MLAIYEDVQLYTTWMSPFRLNDQIVRLNFGALFQIQEKRAKCKQISEIEVKRREMDFSLEKCDLFGLYYL